MNIFTSIVFAAAIFTSLMAVVRTLSGFAVLISHVKLKEPLVEILPVIAAPSFFWGLFYFLVS